MADKDLDELKATVISTQALLSHLLTSLKDSKNALIPEGEEPPNALALASSVASLIHAQTTKLSLLVTNKPFTPTAITRIIKTLSGECIPALASAAELASAANYPRCIHQRVVQDATTILQEFQTMLKEIPLDEHGVEQTQTRGTLSNTGVIWAACDQLKAAGAGGVHEIAAAKADSFLNLIKDALEELREWKQDGEDNQDESSDDEDEDDDDDADADSLDFSMTSKCSPSMLPAATHMLDMIEHIRALFPPLIKRRIKRFPPLSAATPVEDLPSPELAIKLDGLLEVLEIIHDEVDQAAFVLYEQGQAEVAVQMRKLASLAGKCALPMAADWEGGEDEFTAWVKEKYLPKLWRLAAVKIAVDA